MWKSIKVSQLSVAYDGKQVVSDVSFTIRTGQLVGILGPNGAGKSTLMKAMLGLVPREHGEIRLGTEPLKSIQKKIAYVPQRSSIDWDFPIVVQDTVLLGTFPKLSLFRRPTKQDRKWALQCLEQVGMKEFRNNQIGELSGGQQQRVFLARALAQEADVFFLDEPFVGIDVTSEQIIIRILKQLRDEGKTVFVVHHDLSKVTHYFDHLILINKELISAGTVTEVFRPEQLQRAYQAPVMAFSEGGVG
ncbi:metal ABC transporter ATP-binding protein [Paenibacillus yanchengensis]|uniref:Metal ABC transporter ATP-binding protein n=1 Tax=Paenibacillus yanchengensis TaxID=2035833 RepID=A0ABW4YP31_9BACL